MDDIHDCAECGETAWYDYANARWRHIPDASYDHEAVPSDG